MKSGPAIYGLHEDYHSIPVARFCRSVSEQGRRLLLVGIVGSFVAGYLSKQSECKVNSKVTDGAGDFLSIAHASGP